MDKGLLELEKVLNSFKNMDSKEYNELYETARKKKSLIPNFDFNFSDSQITYGDDEVERNLYSYSDNNECSSLLKYNFEDSSFSVTILDAA